MLLDKHETHNKSTQTNIKQTTNQTNNSNLKPPKVKSASRNYATRNGIMIFIQSLFNTPEELKGGSPSVLRIQKKKVVFSGSEISNRSIFNLRTSLMLIFSGNEVQLLTLSHSRDILNFSFETY